MSTSRPWRRSSTWRRSSKAACARRANACASPRSSSRWRLTRTYGRKRTTGSWRTSSRCKTTSHIKRALLLRAFNLELGERSADRIEVTVPTEAILVAARTRYTILDQRFAPVVPFLDQRLAYAKSATLDSGASIGTNTNLREPRNLARHLFRLLAGTTVRSDVFAQANVQ